MEHHQLLDKKLWSYVERCKTSRTDWQYLTVATDKGEAKQRITTYKNEIQKRERKQTELKAKIVEAQNTLIEVEEELVVRLTVLL